MPGGWEHKTWWRNLIEPTKIRLRLRGRDVTGIGQAFSGEQDPQLVTVGMDVYLSKFATSARVRGIARGSQGRPDQQQLRQAVPHEVIVRLVLNPTGTGFPGSGLLGTGFDRGEGVLFVLGTPDLREGLLRN